MDKRLASSFFFGAHRVYGYRLKPFCLLHSVQLEALESPIAVGGDITAAHLIVAAQICSTHEVRTDFRRHTARRIWRDVDAELDSWDAYFADSTSGPATFKRPASGGGSLNAPWQQIIATRLQKELGMSYRDVWTLPEGRILWEYYSLREQIEEDSMILSEDLENEMAEQAQWERDNAQVLEVQRAALMEREEAIKEGRWPIGLDGRPVSLNFKTLTPDV